MQSPPFLCKLALTTPLDKPCGARVKVVLLATPYNIHEAFRSARGKDKGELGWIEPHLEQMDTPKAIPENMRRYFDTEGYLGDMKLGGDVPLTDLNGTVYALWT